jgi:hypothetical protein
MTKIYIKIIKIKKVFKKRISKIFNLIYQILLKYLPLQQNLKTLFLFNDNS